MVKTIEALFDGTVLHPDEPLALAPNTRVRITIEAMLQAPDRTASFLRTARSLNLEGPLIDNHALAERYSAYIDHLIDKYGDR